MNRIRLPALSIALALACVLATSDASAFCTNSRFWSTDVAVYIDNDGSGSVTNTGLAESTIREYLVAAIEQINSGSGVDIRLYYAGTASNASDVNSVFVYTSCSDTICGAGWAGCAFGSVPNVQIALRKAVCPTGGATWTTAFNGGSDVQSVLAHELGHALGLNHSDLTDTCTNTPSGVTSGIMRSFGGNDNTFRWLRRDDVSGLRFKYGSRERSLRWRESDNGQTWWGESSVPGGQLTRTAISASSSQGPFDTYMAATWADGSDRVRGIDRNWTTWSSTAHTIDPSSSGRTWDTPAVAQNFGHSRTLYAWIANESETSYKVRIRWAVHDRSTNTWKYVDGPTTNAKALGAGYDPWSNKFIVSYMDSDQPPTAHIISIYGKDGSFGLIRKDTDLGIRYHEIGQTACNPSGSCMTAISTTGVNGPCLGWIKGRILDDGAYSLESEIVDCTYSHGAADITNDVRDSPQGYVGSFIQGGDGAFVYRRSGSSLSFVTSMNSDLTAVGVGSMNKDSISVKFNAVYAR